MHKIIIADTSCLIVLSKIDELTLLKDLYDEILITSDIKLEFGGELPAWVKVKEVKDGSKQKLLELQIDKGESSAIVLALETPDSTLILDDLKARRIAGRLGLRYTGTIGIIIKAKQRGIIPSIKPVFSKIKLTNFRITEEVETAALKEADEK